MTDESVWGSEIFQRSGAIFIYVYILKKSELQTKLDVANSGCNKFYIGPVSYTHLDVYKRQGL